MDLPGIHVRESLMTPALDGGRPFALEIAETQGAKKGNDSPLLPMERFPLMLIDPS